MNKDSLIRFIKNTSPLSAPGAELLAEKYVPKNIQKNDYILREGQVCNETWFVHSGLLRGYIYDLDGNDITIAFYPENGPANDMFSFFKRVRSKENIQAVTDCEAWYMTYEVMQESFHTMPEFREFGRANLINTYGALQQRMLSMLQETAEQRYLNLMNTHPEILRLAPLKTIATYLGITDTSLSRIRREFVRKQ